MDHNSESASVRWRRIAVVGVVMFILAGCVSAPTPDPDPTTTQPPATTTTFVSDTGRPVEAVDCAFPPDEIAFFCEAYEIILERYVDDLDEAELATAAAEAAAELDEVISNEVLVCPVPSEYFVETCDVAAGAGLGNVETAELMLTGIVSRTLDPNSAYLDPAAFARIVEAESPTFAGIGALVRAEDSAIEGEDKQCSVISESCRLTIVATLEDHPARAAGIEAEDVVAAVDGQDIIGWKVDDVIAAVRGPAGEPVTLLIDRAGTTFEVTIVRALIRVSVIDWEVVDNVGYVRLHDFRAEAGPQFESAVLSLLAEGVDELVFDLRYNPGGLLDTAIDVASVFLPDGEVLITESPEETQHYPVNGNAIVPADMEVSVVVNRASASASEVVAAVLQERGYATIYGENSFGKNTVQQRWGLTNGGAMKLTTARWLTPEGSSFGGSGITPDVALEIPDDISVADLVDAVLNASG